MRQPAEAGVGMGHGGGRHAPRTDRSTHQVHGLRCLRQPLPEQVAVDRPEHQALGAAGRGGDDAHVLSPQAVLLQMRSGERAGVDPQGGRFHG